MTPYPSAAPEGSIPPGHLARRARPLATLAVAFMLAASACREGGGNTSSTPGSKPFSSPSSVAWTDCGSGLQCGKVAVPLDYSNPSGETIKIAIIRKPAKDLAARIGSLLINPGGPGVSGIEYLAAVSGMAELNTRFDLVSFDPRGVGQSAPVRCVSGPQMDNFTALDTVLDDAQEKQAFMQGQLGLRQIQAPGQAGQVAEQGRGLVSTQPEAAFGIFLVVPVQVSQYQLGLAHPAQAMHDNPTTLAQQLAQPGQVRLPASKIIDRLRAAFPPAAPAAALAALRPALSGCRRQRSR